MSYSEHFNLPEMPAGAVDWPAIINDIVAKIERGRTLKLTAAAILAKGDPFYVGSNGQAYKADNVTAFRGVWLSTSTAIGAQGYGQVGGHITTGAGLTPGAPVYVGAAGLTQTQPANFPPPIGQALTATVVEILPVFGMLAQQPVAMLFGETTHNLAADANLTLTTAQNQAGFLRITDTGPVLTAGRDVVFAATVRRLYFLNDTAQTLTCKVAGQAGVAVAAGEEGWLRCNGTDVSKLISDW